MRVRIIGPDGETIEGNVAAKRGRTLAVTVPGVAGYVEFRFILGDWL